MISTRMTQTVRKSSSSQSDEGRQLIENWTKLNSAPSSPATQVRVDERRPAPEMPMRNFLRVVFTC